MWTNYRSSCSQITEWLFYRFKKIPRKATVVDSYLSTNKIFLILLKQDSIMGIFVNTFQNFQNRYFLCNTSRRQLLFLLPLSYPSCMEGQGGRGIEQFRIWCLNFNWLKMHWGSTITHRISETNSSFHVKQRTARKV